MAQRVRERLSGGQRRIHGLVNSVEAIILESSGDRQAVTQETFRAREQREGIAVELSIVQKLHLVGSSETGYAEQTLRHVDLQPFSIAEQHGCRSKQYAIVQHTESSQQIGRFPARRLIHAAAANAFRNDPSNLGYIEVVD